MADVELDHLRQGGDGFRRHIIEPMASVHFEAELFGEFHAFLDTPPFDLGCLSIVIGERITPGAGVNFDHRRADRNRRFDLPRLGSDEQRDPDAGLAQPSDRWHQ